MVSLDSIHKSNVCLPFYSSDVDIFEADMVLENMYTIICAFLSIFVLLFSETSLSKSSCQAMN